MARFADQRMRGLLTTPLFLGLALHPAGAAVIAAGPGTAVPTLAEAVRQAGPGDTIRLAAGTYYECAVLSQRRLTIEGAGPETVLSDRTCEGKALLIARTDDLVVRNLTLARARVGDRNGAGIRLEAQGLTVEGVRFDNNEVGILAGQAGPGTLLLRDCSFVSGGVAGERPTAALMVAAVALLRVERASFEGVRGGQITSAAVATEIVDSTLSTGIEPGAGTVVQASGRLSIENSTIAVGPNRAPHDAAVIVTGDGTTLRGVTLRNTTGVPAVLLLDWTSAPVTLATSTVQSGDALVSRSGEWRHRAGELGRGVAGELRQAAGDMKRAVLGIIRR